MENDKTGKSGLIDYFINTKAKDENQKLKSHIESLQNELEIKITENENLHMDIFDLRNNFESMSKTLNESLNSLKITLEEKNKGLETVKHQNDEFEKTITNLEVMNQSINEKIKQIEEDYKNYQTKAKAKKLALKLDLKEKTTIIENKILIDDFSKGELNVQNYEFYRKSQLSNQISSIIGLINALNSFFHPLDVIIENLGDRYSAVLLEHKNEYKTYNFCCNKIRNYLFQIQAFNRSIFYFIKLFNQIINSQSNLILDSKAQTIINVILLLVNKITVFVEIIGKFQKNLLKEEIRLLDNLPDDLNSIMRINQYFKEILTKMYSYFKILVKKINAFFTFDLKYHLQNIEITSDKEGKIQIKIKPTYNPTIKLELSKDSENLNLLEELINTLRNLKEQINTILSTFKIKIDSDGKIFEILKEEKIRLMKVASLNLNNNRFKESLPDFINSSDKLLKVIEKLKESFEISSSSFSKIRNQSIFRSYLFDLKLKSLSDLDQSIERLYSNYEKSVPFEEAVKNRDFINELMEKQRGFHLEKENFQNKINEYLEEIKKLENKLLEEKNLAEIFQLQNNELQEELAVLKEVLKESKLSYDPSSHMENISTSKSESAEAHESKSQFEDYLKGQKNISDDDYEVLSYDVESGRQRSSFKLSSSRGDPIQLTKFIPQIENNDITVLYYRKILDKLHQYSSKVKSFDIKVMSNIHQEELKQDYENKLAIITKQKDSDLENTKNEMMQEIEQTQSELNTYKSQIDFLCTQITSTNLKVEKVRDKLCKNCKPGIENILDQ